MKRKLQYMTGGPVPKSTAPNSFSKTQNDKKAEEQVKYNNPRKPVHSDDAILNLLSDNPAIMDVPIVGDYIRKKALGIGSVQETAMAGSKQERKSDNNYTGTKSGKTNLLKQYLFEDQNLSKATDKPTNDYLEFLPTYKLKDKLGVSDEINRLISEDSKEIKEVIKNKKNKYGTRWGYELYKDAPDLGRHKGGIGYDEEKQMPYYSISDAWDFEPKDYKKNYDLDEKGNKVYQQAYLMHKAGKPFKIYDRFYIDPKTMKYVEKRNGGMLKYIDNEPPKKSGQFVSPMNMDYQISKAEEMGALSLTPELIPRRKDATRVETFDKLQGVNLPAPILNRDYNNFRNRDTITSELLPTSPRISEKNEFFNVPQRGRIMDYDKRKNKMKYGGPTPSQVQGATATAAGVIDALDAGNEYGNQTQGSQIGKGAMTGASLGTAILPGIGTAVGAIGGAALGYVNSQKDQQEEMRMKKQKAKQANDLALNSTRNLLTNNPYSFSGERSNMYKYGGKLKYDDGGEITDTMLDNITSNSVVLGKDKGDYPRMSVMNNGPIKPYVTSNPKDKRIKAYSDSLKRYEHNLNYASQSSNIPKSKLISTPFNKNYSYKDFLEDSSSSYPGNWPIKPIGTYNVDGIIPAYKKPQQKVIYRPETSTVKFDKPQFENNSGSTELTPMTGNYVAQDNFNNPNTKEQPVQGDYELNSDYIKRTHKAQFGNGGELKLLKIRGLDRENNVLRNKRTESKLRNFPLQDVTLKINNTILGKNETPINQITTISEPNKIKAVTQGADFVRNKLTNKGFDNFVNDIQTPKVLSKKAYDTSGQNFAGVYTPTDDKSYVVNSYSNRDMESIAGHEATHDAQSAMSNIPSQQIALDNLHSRIRKNINHNSFTDYIAEPMEQQARLTQMEMDVNQKPNNKFNRMKWRMNRLTNFITHKHDTAINAFDNLLTVQKKKNVFRSLNDSTIGGVNKYFALGGPLLKKLTPRPFITNPDQAEIWNMQMSDSIYRVEQPFDKNPNELPTNKYVEKGANYVRNWMNAKGQDGSSIATPRVLTEKGMKNLEHQNEDVRGSYDANSNQASVKYNTNKMMQTVSAHEANHQRQQLLENDPKQQQFLQSLTDRSDKFSNFYNNNSREQESPLMQMNERINRNPNKNFNRLKWGLSTMFKKPYYYDKLRQTLPKKEIFNSLNDMKKMAKGGYINSDIAVGRLTNNNPNYENGFTNPEKTKAFKLNFASGPKPLITSNIRRKQAYDDSLTLYNANSKIKSEFDRTDKNNVAQFLSRNPAVDEWAINKKRLDLYNGVETQPQSLLEKSIWDNKDDLNVITARQWNKPNQEVIYQPDNSLLPNVQTPISSSNLSNKSKSDSLYNETLRGVGVKDLKQYRKIPGYNSGPNGVIPVTQSVISQPLTQPVKQEITSQKQFIQSQSTRKESDIPSNQGVEDKYRTNSQQNETNQQYILRLQRERKEKLQSQNKIKYFALGGYLKSLNSTDQLAVGRSHKQGGIKFPEHGVEIEGKETKSGDFIFSHALGFAKQSLPLMKAKGKIEKQLLDNPYDKVAKDSHSMLTESIENLKQQQETMKAKMGMENNMNSFIKGGPIPLLKKKKETYDSLLQKWDETQNFVPSKSSTELNGNDIPLTTITAKRSNGLQNTQIDTKTLFGNIDIKKAKPIKPITPTVPEEEIDREGLDYMPYISNGINALRRFPTPTAPTLLNTESIPKVNLNARRAIVDNEVAQQRKSMEGLSTNMRTAMTGNLYGKQATAKNEITDSELRANTDIAGRNAQMRNQTNGYNNQLQNRYNDEITTFKLAKIQNSQENINNALDKAIDVKQDKINQKNDNENLRRYLSIFSKPVSGEYDKRTGDLDALNTIMNLRKDKKKMFGGTTKLKYHGNI